MKQCYSIYFFRTLAFIILLGVPHVGFTQIGANLESTDNTNCDGAPCDYNGPSILINELMLSPTTHDGSMWGANVSQQGEWIELYNPNICESVDISCFYLGNNANDGGAPRPGGYVIPPGTVVPAAGFALIRGVNAAAVPSHRLVENGGNVIELVVSGEGVCVGDGTRLWFPNSGGWFAFYDNNGVPQDAVSWASGSNTGNYACTPPLTGCGFAGTLPNYNEFPADRKNYILNTSAADYQGQSIRRVPDGGNWAGPGAPTYADCNASCIDPQLINCNGTATVNPYGGTPPYTYLWNDSKAQTTQIADQLCAGEFCVTITDAIGNVYEECVTVEDFTFEDNLEVNICEGETYTLPNNTKVSESGEYPVVLQSGLGCDSIITVNLEVHPHYSFELNPQICPGESYTLPDGVEVSETGTYQASFQSQMGCDSIYTVNLVVSNPITISVDAEICEGKTYSLPDGSEVSDAGSYDVFMSGGDAACDTLYTVNLDYFPEFQITADELNHISCFGEIDGSISLDISGSTEPYTYAWSDGIDHGTQALNLEQGDYTVVVTDTHGCESEAEFEIIEPQPVSISASADELICINADSELVASANGGTGDFTYHWGHTASQDASVTVSPLVDTAYTVFARDENLCETEVVTLNVAVINMLADSLEVSSDGLICRGDETTISALYDGEYPPFTYAWSHGVPSGPGPHAVSPNETTTYTVTVSDDCGNEVSKEIEITVASLPVPEIAALSNISCYGMDDGTAQIEVSQGSPDFTFTWSDGNDHGETGQDLTPGDYTVHVSDLHGCEGDISFEIIEPQPVSISASADELICINADSELVASANGGTGDFTYHWGHTSSHNANVTVSPLVDTAYTVFARDENLCETEVVTLNVAVINMFADSLEVSSDGLICRGDETTISALYDGEYPPYTYAWSHGVPSGPGPHAVSPNETTTYTVTVSDDCGNEVSKEIEITVASLPVPEIAALSNISCYGMDDGTAQIEVSQGSPDFTFTWSDGNDHGET